LSVDWKRVIDGDSGDGIDELRWDEKSRKKNDYDEDDGMKQEVDSKGKVMIHVEISDL